MHARARGGVEEVFRPLAARQITAAGRHAYPPCFPIPIKALRTPSIHAPHAHTPHPNRLTSARMTSTARSSAPSLYRCSRCSAPSAAAHAIWSSKGSSTWPSSVPAGERSSRTALPTNSMLAARAGLTPGGRAETFTLGGGGRGANRGRNVCVDINRNRGGVFEICTAPQLAPEPDDRRQTPRARHPSRHRPMRAPLTPNAACHSW